MTSKPRLVAPQGVTDHCLVTMKHVAVVYCRGTRQSVLAAHRIREVLHEAGIDSEGITIDNYSDAVTVGICPFDAVIVGWPSWGLRLPFLLEEWVRKHAIDLAKVPTYLLMICPCAAGDRDRLYRSYVGAVRSYFSMTELVPHRSICVAGVRPLEIWNWPKRLIGLFSVSGPSIQSQNPGHELVEWEKVTRFAQKIVSDTLADETLSIADFTRSQN